MKNHHHNHPIHSPLPTHEDVAVRAFQLWTDGGQPENRDEANWLEAEKQLIAHQTAPAVSAPSATLGERG